jgi:hypothetical protein
VDDCGDCYEYQCEIDRLEHVVADVKGRLASAESALRTESEHARIQTARADEALQRLAAATALLRDATDGRPVDWVDWIKRAKEVGGE